MKKQLFCIAFSILSIATIYAQKNEFNPKDFAHTYFNAWNKTQAPNANAKDVENFLALLTDDVALQHFPYDTTDVREPSGKEVIRKGMSRWTGNNTSYRATLIEVNYGHNVIIIKYKAIATSVDKKTQKERSITRNNVEVLELDNGKISIIRKYGKIHISKTFIED